VDTVYCLPGYELFREMAHAELDTIKFVGFEVLTADVIKSYIFWEVTP
jgi:hypothetical protein